MEQPSGAPLPRRQYETYEVHGAGGVFTFTPIRPAQVPWPGQGPASPRLVAAPITFETVSITRGATSLSSAAPPSLTLEEQGWALGRGETTEHLSPRDLGLEQSWSFARRPSGQGALALRVRVSGHTLAKASAQGLHFRDEATGIGVLYTHGWWIDAVGKRTRVPARYEDGEIRLEVSSHTLEASAYPAVLDPTISTEFLMQDALFPPVPGHQLNPAVALDTGTQRSLVVWSQEEAGSYGIYGAILNPNGTLFKGGIPISVATGEQINPAVSFDGSQFLVVWQDDRDGSSTDIFAARVSRTGTVIDAAGIRLTGAPNTQSYPQTVFDGTHHVVVWQDARNNNLDIFAARVTSAGTVMDPGGVAISTVSGAQRNPALAVSVSKILVAWQDDSGGTAHVYGMMMPAGGSLLPTPRIDFDPSAATQSAPSLAFHAGTGAFLVAWSDLRSGDGNILGVRVSGSTGAVLDAPALSLSTATDEQLTPAVQATSDGFFVTWEDWRSGFSSDIYSTRVSSTGQLADPADLLISSATSDELAPAAVFIPSTKNLLVLYSAPDPAGTVYRIRGRQVTRESLGTACTQSADCSSGFCVDGVCCDSACGGGAANDCSACGVAQGASADGTCTPLTGTTCNDHDQCTQTDICQAGTCNGSNPRLCFVSSENVCVTALCAPATGVCYLANVADGTGCDDSDLCTQTDSCQAGTCVGSSAVTCATPDSCHGAGTCDPATGTCSSPAFPDGTGCSDGNLCTLTDTCQAGACIGSNAVTCTTLNSCHNTGTCNPVTGTCSSTALPDGTACSDGNLCTQTDSCQAGACTGTNAVTCTALDSCHNNGTCDPATGACSNPTKPDGTACSDGLACTLSDSCQAGVCLSGSVGTEVCNSQDDNCDGLVDNIPAASCSPKYCATGISYCSGTSTACAMTGFSPADSACVRASTSGKCDNSGQCCITETVTTPGYTYYVEVTQVQTIWFPVCAWFGCGWWWWPFTFVNTWQEPRWQPASTTSVYTCL